MFHGVRSERGGIPQIYDDFVGITKSKYRTLFPGWYRLYVSPKMLRFPTGNMILGDLGPTSTNANPHGPHTIKPY